MLSPGSKTEGLVSDLCEALPVYTLSLCLCSLCPRTPPPSWPPVQAAHQPPAFPKTQYSSNPYPLYKHPTYPPASQSQASPSACLPACTRYLIPVLQRLLPGHVARVPLASGGRQFLSRAGSGRPQPCRLHGAALRLFPASLPPAAQPDATALVLPALSHAPQTSLELGRGSICQPGRLANLSHPLLLPLSAFDTQVWGHAGTWRSKHTDTNMHTCRCIELCAQIPTYIHKYKQARYTACICMHKPVYRHHMHIITLNYTDPHM